MYICRKLHPRVGLLAGPLRADLKGYLHLHWVYMHQIPVVCGSLGWWVNKHCFTAALSCRMLGSRGRGTSFFISSTITGSNRICSQIVVCKTQCCTHFLAMVPYSANTRHRAKTVELNFIPLVLAGMHFVCTYPSQNLIQIAFPQFWRQMGTSVRLKTPTSCRCVCPLPWKCLPPATSHLQPMPRGTLTKQQANKIHFDACRMCPIKSNRNIFVSGRGAGLSLGRAFTRCAVQGVSRQPGNFSTVNYGMHMYKLVAMQLQLVQPELRGLGTPALWRGKGNNM